MKKFWTQDEIDTLNKYYVSEGPSKIMKRLPGRTKDSIRSKAGILGLKREIETLYEFCQGNPDKAYLLDEWDYEKNKELGLTPQTISYSSNKKVWWKSCINYKHNWQASPNNRTRSFSNSGKNLTSKGTSIPELSLYYYLYLIYPDVKHKYTEFGFELDIYIPSVNTAIEYDGSYWHRNKLENDNKKDRFCKDNGIRLIRLRSKELEKTESAEIISLYENTYKQISEGIDALFNLLEMTHDFKIDIDTDYEHILKNYLLIERKNNLTTTHPELAAQWHPVKNGDLKPEHFTSGSDKKVWWLLPYDDPNTGKHFDFEWEARIVDRKNGIGCPFLSGRAVWPGFNDLTTQNLKLAKEWNNLKNFPLMPYQVTAGSDKKVWWKCRTCRHEWIARIGDRNAGGLCPSCGC